MSTVECSACSGAGKTTCPYCRGQWRFYAPGREEAQSQPCPLCGGNRRVRCAACDGTGRVAAPDAPAGAHGPVPMEIEGRWKGGSWDTFDFIVDSGGYHVNHFNHFGLKIEEGRAMWDGNTVTLNLASPMGPCMAKLRLRGNRLEGEMMAAALGMKLPLVIVKQEPGSELN